MWCIYRERNKGKKKEEKEVCNGHVTVARGRGGEGREERGAQHGGLATLGPLGPPL